jgi:hypothetical protein
MFLHDSYRLDDAAQIRITEHGYLTAMPRVARTGIQLYGGDEMGRPNMRVVRVYRPEDEVFHKDSLRSLAGKPVTNDHPTEAVTADNWAKLARGGLGEDVLRDGQFIRIPMTLMDKNAIKDVQNGKSELSAGYTCDIEWKAGTTPQGEQYDAIQRNIRFNHLAVVDAARGGSALTIGDKTNEDHLMNDKTMTTITVDSVPLSLDAVSAGVINAALNRMSKNIEGLQGKLDESTGKEKTSKDSLDASVAKHTTEMAAKDKEIEDLKKQVADLAMTPAKLDTMLADRNKVVDVAKVVLGDKLVVKDKSVAEIKRQVVDAKLGDKAKGWNEVQYDASFDALTADVKPGETQQQGGNAPFLDGRPSVYDVARAFSAPGPQNTVDEAYAKRDKDLSEAWRNPTKAA